MSHPIKILLAKPSIAVMISMVILLVILIPSKPAAVQGQDPRPPTPVEVRNPLPLPVAMTGTGNIAGTVNSAQSGAWTVGATQLGSWGVSINGIPTVAFSNTPETPLYVVFSEPAKQRYRTFVDVLSDDYGIIRHEISTEDLGIPAGKQFVVEMMSLQIETEVPENWEWGLYDAVLWTDGPGYYDRTPLFFCFDTLSEPSGAAGYIFKRYISNVQTEITYTGFFQLWVHCPPRCYAHLTLFGYLEDMPLL